MSDTHWGFGDPKINPDFAGTLKKAVAAVNALDQQPDFVVFTGDLTHTTDDPKIRRTRLAPRTAPGSQARCRYLKKSISASLFTRQFLYM